jgi:hypothetical protein
VRIEESRGEDRPLQQMTWWVGLARVGVELRVVCALTEPRAEIPSLR